MCSPSNAAVESMQHVAILSSSNEMWPCDLQAGDRAAGWREHACVRVCACVCVCACVFVYEYVASLKIAKLAFL